MVALCVFAAICALSLILIVNVSINTLSGIRAYVAGEGYWAKAQKESVIHLSSYILTEDEDDFASFKSVLKVNLGDKIARQELLKDEFDYDITYQGFLEGQNHPNDIPQMIDVFRRLQWTPQVQKSIDAWTEADLKLEELVNFADSLHLEIQTTDASLEQKTVWVNELEKYDHELTELEVAFSDSMGDMARLVNTILRWSVIFLGLLLLSIGIWLTYRFLNSTKKWMKTLKESELKFKNVLSNSRDILYKMNLETKEYEYFSPALENMLGYEEKDFLEGGVEFTLSKVHPDDKEEMDDVVDSYDEVNSSNFLPTVEFRLKDIQGNWVWVSNARTLVKDEDGNPEAIVGTVRDISTRKKQDQKLKKSLAEKEVLLQEIHHRVKNNLAIISSLLELQKENISEDMKELLSSSQARIKSIAKVHEKLYKSTTLSDIPLDTYIEELAEEIKKAYTSKEKEIELSLDVSSINVDIDDAIPIGLILNELINNAFKHAFKDLDKGIIKISLQGTADSMELIVANNGNKLAEDFNPEESDSLGMTLIKVLIKKINGSLEINSSKWTSFNITFNLDK
jgi:PAS domain S-box-containing protein